MKGQYKPNPTSSVFFGPAVPDPSGFMVYSRQFTVNNLLSLIKKGPHPAAILIVCGIYK